MNLLFEDCRLMIGECSESPFLNRNDIYQDGTTPMYRDTDGRLWAMSGHSHLGHIGMFCGTTLEDMKELYPIATNFCVGHAEYAFSRIPYPEGVKARGSIWPFGLYICPNTHRFFCFFHNESGWNGKGTAYDSLGPCDRPRRDSDFRHIGLMHSDDEGKNWTFDRWILAAEHVCFSEKYIPDGVNALGQKLDNIGLGSGDFSLYVEPDGAYMYLFYNIIHVDMVQEKWICCDTYVARSRKRTDGIMGDFVKYYDGAFCEAGLFGKETPIIRNSWHPRAVYSKKYDTFLISSSPIHPENDAKRLIADYMEVRTGKDLIHWSEPTAIYHEGKLFGNHYMAMVDDSADTQPNVIQGDSLTVLTNHNGTDVMRYRAYLVSEKNR